MSVSSYIPVNKGHFDLDTPQRVEEFQQKMAQGWKSGEYKKYRELWHSLPKSRSLSEYPLLVDLELASVCNLKCPMCYTITEGFKQQVTKGFMDFDLFKRVIDEIAGKVFSVRLSFRGEATLHKNFVDCAKYAKAAGIPEVSSLTNGSKLNLKYFEKLVEAGIDWITISIDGMSDQYDKIRKPLTFEGMVQKLKDIKEFKNRNGLTKPVIKVQGIWPAIRPYPSEYLNALTPVTDLVAFNPLIDYLRNDDEILYEQGFHCPQVYQRLVVGSDGRVMMCSNDEDTEVVVGDAYKQSIHEIWHSDKLRKIREIHDSKDGFKEFKPCRLCYYPRKAVPDEIAVVNGREVHIENYVNRAQEVGR